MRFVDRVAAPAIQRVVNGHARLKLVEIFRMHPRQSQRHRQQARGLRRKLGPAWLRTVHGVGYALEGPA